MMEQNLQNDNNVLNMTIILDDMWRGFKKFFPLVILLVAACSAGAYYFFKMNYHPQYEAYKSMVVQAKFDYVYEDDYGNVFATDSAFGQPGGSTQLYPNR